MFVGFVVFLQPPELLCYPLRFHEQQNLVPPLCPYIYIYINSLNYVKTASPKCYSKVHVSISAYGINTYRQSKPKYIVFNMGTVLLGVQLKMEGLITFTKTFLFTCSRVKKLLLTTVKRLRLEFAERRTMYSEKFKLKRTILFTVIMPEHTYQTLMNRNYILNRDIQS